VKRILGGEEERLDLESDRKALTETIDELQPRLLILDPFVRLHRVDENVSGEVAPLADRVGDPDVPDLAALAQNVDHGRAHRQPLSHLADGQEPRPVAAWGQ
jgi:hypothetical protein